MTSSAEPPASEIDDEAQPAPVLGRFRRRKVLSGLSIQSKLLVLFLAISILSAGIVGLIGFQSGRSSLRASVFDRLTEIRESQSRQLEAEVADLENSLVIYTRGSTCIGAVQAFTGGFNQLSDASIDPKRHQSIVDHYNAFLRTTEEQTGDKLDAEALLPTSNSQRYLQAHYTATSKSDDQSLHLDDAGDGSAWSAANARYNDFFRQIVKRFEFQDALLLDTQGNVVYTAFKGVDLGTNILNGPYRESNLRDAYRRAIASNNADYVTETDFERYQPAKGAPTAWLLSPVGPKGRIEGVLALQFPISKINRLMTADKQWASAGMGRTGETYLVGPDDLMLSDSRRFLENTEEYKKDAVHAGTPPDVAEEAIRQGTTTLLQPASTEGVNEAQRGQKGTLITQDYLGRETLQAYAPLTADELNWSIVASIDTEEAFAPDAAFTRTVVLSTTAIIFATCILAMLMAQLFLRPIRRLESGARQISGGDYDVTIPVQSRDEFGDLTVAFNEMSRSLAIKEELLIEQRRENDRLLLSLMPAQVVRRYREGEETISQDHQNVTVIFADIVGLNELSDHMSSDEALALVNDLVRQVDAAAEGLGVERVRTSHNGYLASCGLNIPRIDNVRRTVDFAIEMQRIVVRSNGQSGQNLDIRAAINTGTVTSGLVGRSTIVYDMWGAAVNLAYQVQSGVSQPGVYVTAPVYEAMRDSRQFSAAGQVTVDGVEQSLWRLAQR